MKGPKKIRDNKRTKILQERKQHQLNQDEEEKRFVANVTKRISDNISRMDSSIKVTKSNVNDYFKVVYRNVSEEELERAVTIRANRLSVLWESVLKELEKLDQILKPLLADVDPDDNGFLTEEQVDLINSFKVPRSLIDIYRTGIRCSLDNLKGGDHEKRSLAIVSSGERQKFIKIS